MNSGDIIDRWVDAIWAERGLSRLTLDAYRRDLVLLGRWLEEQANSELADASTRDLLAYLAWRGEQGLHTRSLARQLSSIKQFYRWLSRQGMRSDNPCENIEAPRLSRSLPGSLSESDMERLLAAPDVRTPFGLRDRAMLEMMYGSGLRVSELVGLTLAQVSRNIGLLRLSGKGAKERVIPLGELASDWLGRYLKDARHVAAGLLATPEEIPGPGRHQQRVHAPFPAPCLCHSSTQSRRRSAQPANAAGA